MRCCILQQHSSFGKGLAPLPLTPFEFPSLPVAGAETGKMYILILHYTKNMYMCRVELMAVTIETTVFTKTPRENAAGPFGQPFTAPLWFAVTQL